MEIVETVSMRLSQHVMMIQRWKRRDSRFRLVGDIYETYTLHNPNQRIKNTFGLCSGHISSDGMYFISFPFDCLAEDLDET